jgi:monoamine oxidase
MPRAGRSPLFSHLQRAYAAARRENRRRGGGHPPTPTRRGFLTGVSGGVIAAYARSARAMHPGPGATIAVVEAGVAGLNATFLLAQAGFNVALYEGSDHIGGRIQTKSNAVAAGVYTELGGEFIDSDHADMLGLAQRFGFGLIDTAALSETGLQVAYYAKGRLRSEAEVIAAFQPLAAIVDNDLAQLSDTITYDSHSPFDAPLDRTNLRDYLQRNRKVDWLYDVLEAAYVNEFGLNLEDQSSLNFVLTIGTDTSSGFQIYGASDQRYKIEGGNHQIVAALASAVSDRITLGQRLVGLGQLKNGRFVLSFQDAQGLPGTVVADFVVLCIPFTILRTIAINVPLPPIKRKAVQQLGYGTNAKLILGFQTRVWRAQESTVIRMPICRSSRAGTRAASSRPSTARTRSIPEATRRWRCSQVRQNSRLYGCCPASKRCFQVCDNSGLARPCGLSGRPIPGSAPATPLTRPDNGQASEAPRRPRWETCISRGNTRASTGKDT